MKEFPDFDEKMAALWPAIGGFNAALIEAAQEAGDAHQLLYKLAMDPDAADRIAGLSPSRQGAALAKMAREAPAAVVAPRAQSQAPAPITPIRKGGGAPEPRLDSGSQVEFERAFKKMRDARG